MIFIQNKYTTTYYSIIQNAKSRTITEGYTENHHIIPKCLDGDNSSDNLVTLTAREHFLCHWLLTKMVKNNHYYKMIHAWNLMLKSNDKQGRYVPCSRVYKMLKEKMSEHNPMKDPEIKAKHKAIVNSKEHREKLSKGKQGIFVGEKNGFYGKHHTEEYKAKASLDRKGIPVKPFSKTHLKNLKKACKDPERCGKISKALTGRVYSEETLQRMREGQQRRRARDRGETI